MKIKKSELKRIVENYLLEESKEYVDGEYTYRKSDSAQYGWEYKTKSNPKWKPINKAGAKNLEATYGKSSKDAEDGEEDSGPGIFDKISSYAEDVYNLATDNVSKDKGNLDALNAAWDEGDMSKYYGLVIQRLVKSSKESGLGFFELLTPYIGAGIVPLHYQILFAFITLRTENFDVKDSGAKKAMHHVARYAWKRQGKPKGEFYIGYPDFYNCPENKKRPTYGYGMSIKSPNKDNLYAQLSAFFGNCIASKNSDGSYDINDQYDFNVYRSPSARGGKNEKAMAKEFAEAIPSIANTYSALKKFLGYLFGKGSGNAAEYLEPLLLQYETQLDYKGVPTSITTTPPPEETEEESMFDSLYQGAKDLVGLGDED